MLGMDTMAAAIDKLAIRLEKSTREATIEGVERGAKILGDIIAAKMEELYNANQKGRPR